MDTRQLSFIFASIYIAIFSTTRAAVSNSSTAVIAPTQAVNSSSFMNTTASMALPTPTVTITVTTWSLSPVASTSMPIHPTGSTATVNPSASQSTEMPTQPSTQPTQPTTAKPGTAAPVKSSGFDAGSFVGGIILGAVVVAGGVIGYNWYKNKRKSYHSL